MDCPPELEARAPFLGIGPRHTQTSTAQSAINRGKSDSRSGCTPLRHKYEGGVFISAFNYSPPCLAWSRVPEVHVPGLVLTGLMLGTGSRWPVLELVREVIWASADTACSARRGTAWCICLRLHSESCTQPRCRKRQKGQSRKQGYEEAKPSC